MTVINGHGPRIRVDQLVRVDGKWHAIGDGDRTPCGHYVPDTPAVLSVPEVPEEDRCQTPACRNLWRQERFHGSSWHAGVDDEPAPLDDMDLQGDDRPLNPAETEAGIRKCARLIHFGVRKVSDAEADFREKAAAHDRAFAQAYLDFKGPAHAKKHAAEIATVATRDARDFAELVFRHVDRRQRALLAQLDAVRSINTSVRAMYAAETGVGR